MHAQFAKVGSSSYRLAGSSVAFENKDGVRVAERKVADALKETFRHRLPKQEQEPFEDDPMDAQQEDSDPFGDKPGDYDTKKEDAAEVKLEAGRRKVTISDDSEEEDIF